MDLPILDKDLLALQEARTLVVRARVAAREFARMDPAQAWRITEAVCRACEERAEYYARWAVEETRIGRTEDKVFKNLLASGGLLNFYRHRQLGGVRVDRDNKMLLVARPAGVVFGLVASTSPIATLYFKVLSCLMTRNAVILSPHPLALNCSVDAADHLREAAERAGAPGGVIQIQRTPTLDATHAIMRDPGVNVILATGGSAMVRAAYGSGNPALGVGPGNVPVFVDASADIDLAVSETLQAKCFDYGSPCSAPSAVFVHRHVAEHFDRRMRAGGAFYCDRRQQDLLEKFAFPGNHLNPRIVGRAASWIAEQAGIEGASGASVLVGLFDEVSADVPMVREKLSPILGVKYVADRDQAIGDASAMLAVSGAGHSSGIFSEDVETITLWGCALDVNRTVVNKGTSMGVIGDGTRLAPTLTIGTGFAGRSSVGENVGPEHLINWKRIAFAMKEAEVGGPAIDPPGKRHEDPVSQRVRAAIEAAVTAALGTRGTS